MDKRVGCQPFRDVLIVGRRPALVWAVREETEHEDGQRALVKGRGLCRVMGFCLALWNSGRSTAVVWMMDSQSSSFNKLK